ERRGGHRANRRAESGRRGPDDFRLSSHPEPGLAEGVRGFSSAPGAEEAGRGTRRPTRGTGGEALRMADHRRRCIAGGAVTACLTLSTIGTAAAQQPQGITDAPATPEFFSRFDFNMSAAKL